MRRKARCIGLSIFVLLGPVIPAFVVAQPIVFVDRNAIGANTGANWTDAFTDLQNAFLASSCDTVQPGTSEVWVAAGTYRPDAGTGDRLHSFVLPDGITIYGGFAGVETERVQRDPAVNVTILSGDIGSVGVTSDNSFHVVTANAVSSATLLDGFVITGGNASASTGLQSAGGGVLMSSGDPTIRNCRVTANRATNAGGGLYADFSSNPSLVNCTFSANRADNGAAAFTATGSPNFINCRFFDNDATIGGGGLYVRAQGVGQAVLVNCWFTGNTAAFGGGLVSETQDAAAPRVINCSLFGNSATNDGGGIHSSHFGASGPELAVQNTILWENNDSGGMDQQAQLFALWTILGPPVVANSCIQGWTGGGTGNISGNPLFADDDGPDNTPGTEDDDLQLSNGSPCIDAGDNGLLPTDALDLDRDQNTAEPLPHDHVTNPRVVDGDANTTVLVDMGAYEFPVRLCAIVNTGQIVVLNPSGGAADPFLGALAVVTNTTGPNGATVCATQTRQDISPSAGGFSGRVTNLRIDTSLVNNTYLMSLLIPFDVEDAHGAPFAGNLQYYNATMQAFELAVAGNTQNSPGHPGPVGDRFTTVGPFFPPLSMDLGDYGVHWDGTTRRGFVWANVDHTTDFAFLPVSAGLTCNPFCDCNGNGVDDAADIAGGVADCNANGVPDVCDLASGSVDDCDSNQVPDICDVVTGVVPDCNFNGTPDECDLASGSSPDINGNNIPDDCDRLGTCGDLDVDGFIDIDDYAILYPTVTGPAATPGPPAGTTDFDADGDVDGEDLVIFAERFSGFPGVEPDCGINGPTLRVSPRCLSPGETMSVTVNVPPLTAGTLHVLLIEDGDDDVDLGNPLAGVVTALNGSAAYTVSLTAPTQPRAYLVLARVLDLQGRELALDGLDIGVRPNLSGVPGDICTFEAPVVNAPQLLAQVQQAVAGQMPMTLNMGSQSFQVFPESAADMLDSQTIVDEPTLFVFRGTVVGEADSSVTMTFYAGSVHAVVDRGGEEPESIYLGPVQVYDSQASSDQYIAYSSHHVGVTDIKHAEPPPVLQAAALSNDGVAAVSCANRNILINLYYDHNDPFGTRFRDFAAMAAVFRSEINTSLRLNLQRRINSDGYRDGVCGSDPDLMTDFACDPFTTVANADIQMLMTYNPNHINYNNNKLFGCGQYFYRPAGTPKCGDPSTFHDCQPSCWIIHPTGTISFQPFTPLSDHHLRILGCHELGHVLDLRHRDEPLSYHCHARLQILFDGSICLLPKHRHYSIMKAKLFTPLHWTDYLYAVSLSSGQPIYSIRIEAKWPGDDRQHLLATLKTYPARFCP